MRPRRVGTPGDRADTGSPPIRLADHGGAGGVAQQDRAGSDYPTIGYEAMDGGDAVEMEKLLDLEKQSQYIAEAFAAWWKIDEKATLQVYDRGGEYTAGTACIRPDTVENEGSCL
jgi:hypothetical protein